MRDSNIDAVTKYNSFYSFRSLLEMALEGEREISKRVKKGIPIVVVRPSVVEPSGILATALSQYIVGSEENLGQPSQWV